MHRIRLIDRGGFGVVHEVETTRGERLACKSFDPQVNTEEDREKLRRRFAREVRIQSQIRHPNIMPIREHNLNASPPWFTMPLAENSILKKIEEDRENNVLDPEPWQDILAAVEELHRLGYVHRDLKPANILQFENKWLLSDFGLILPTARDTTILTSSHSAYGSHYYAAPEQAQDFRNTQEQADIFALGCILHDIVDPIPKRIPYAQIRIEGVYGPLLEKCTETKHKKRFPTIAALRASLFDLWHTSHFTAPTPDDAALLDAVIANPTSIDDWRRLIGHLESLDKSARDPILRAINEELIVCLSSLDDVLFGRVLTILCYWTEGTSFEWAYCDVVGDRLLVAYRTTPVRLRCIIVLSALRLAVSHNRWHVMEQVGAMLSPTSDEGLIDRIIIEMNLNDEIIKELLQIERIIHWPRHRWHEKLGRFITVHEEQKKG